MVRVRFDGVLQSEFAGETGNFGRRVEECDSSAQKSISGLFPTPYGTERNSEATLSLKSFSEVQKSDQLLNGWEERD